MSIILLTILHLGLSLLLPYPLSKINIIFAILILVMLWSESGLVVWISFFIHFLIELFASTPFGVILFSGTISILIGFWLYRSLYTDRSWYAALTLCFTTLLLYRIFYLLGLFFSKTMIKDLYIPLKLIFITSGWEFLFTALFVAIFYFIMSKFTHKFRSGVVEQALFKI